MRILETDVLVVGGGGAGLRAAVEARRLGRDVVLVSKSQMGLANCTASAAGGFRLAVDGDGKSLGKREHFDETVFSGRFLNDKKLVKIMVDEGVSRFLELKEFGVPVYPERGHGYVRSLKPPAGAVLSGKLAEYVSGIGVRELSNAFCFDLLHNGDSVEGVLCFDRKGDDVFAVSAKSTVLATGGYASIYRFTDNTPLSTGDGVALAYQAGASLQDMEFVQFVTRTKATKDSTTSIPDMTMFVEATKSLVLGGVLFNSEGEAVMERYGLLEQPVLRDNLAIAVGREVHEGRDVDGGLIFDLTQASPEALKTLPSKFYGPWKEYARRFSTGTRISLFPVTHYTMGGVRINERCGVGVDGLYAAGEVTGGVDGANRLGGNALTEIFVFGAIAGREAARDAEDKPQPEPNLEYLDHRLREVKRILGRPKRMGCEPRKIKKRIKNTMNRNLSPVRSQSGINQTLEDLRRIREDLKRVYAVNFEALREAFEAKFMLIVAEAVSHAALTREESRGPHYRIEHPERDDENWLANLIVTKQNGEMKILKRDVNKKRVNFIK